MSYYPKLRILQGVEGAAVAEGYTVIIDVFRAFSTACYAVSQGAKAILPVADVGEALTLHRKHPHWIIMGERKGIKVPGFDLGNSPYEIKNFGSFNNKMIVQTTSNGTRGIAAARKAEMVVTGSFVNAGAIRAHINELRPSRLDLVCMGSLQGPTLEDNLCASYLAKWVKGKRTSMDLIRRKIYQDKTVQRFQNSTNEHHPIEDLDLCLSADIFDFILFRKTDAQGHALLYPQYFHKNSNQEPVS